MGHAPRAPAPRARLTVPARRASAAGRRPSAPVASPEPRPPDRQEEVCLRSGRRPSGGVRAGGGGTLRRVRSITLDQLLKHRNVVDSGGEAKMLIQAGHVRVNGEIETRRGRKLATGDRVEMEGIEGVIVVTAEEARPHAG